MNSKTKLKFIAWARKQNQEYSDKRVKHIRDNGFPEKIGRSIMPSSIRKILEQKEKDDATNKS